MYEEYSIAISIRVSDTPLMSRATQPANLFRLSWNAKNAMKAKTVFGALGLLVAGIFVTPTTADADPARGWLSWRGPQQNGASLEKNLPDKIDAKDALWVADFPGQSAPVIANGKLYIIGYLGEDADLQEG